MEYGILAAWISLVVLLYLAAAVYLLTRKMVRSCLNVTPPPLRLEVIVVEHVKKALAKHD